MQDADQTMRLETITTLPTYPLRHPALEDELMRMALSKGWATRYPVTVSGQPKHAKRDPLWFQLSVYFGGVLLLGTGVFFATLGILR